MRNTALGVYISLPFCRSKCTYCNFASGVYPASEHANYVHRLTQDIVAAGEWAQTTHVQLPRQVDTIYLGGGTPSLLPPDLIRELFGALRQEFDLLPNAEITMECAPGQIADATLAAMVEVGVNRVSLGVQSFIDREAQTSGRLHTRSMVLDDLARLRAAGIANINLDLIAGLAGQTFASWDESLAVLLETGVPHASVYMLEVDEDSRLGREMLAGGARYFAGLVPSDDAIARMYETALERLESAGLQQYEISNFARPGFASQHNLRYWERRPYLGLGLDASSALPGLGEKHGSVLRAKTTDELRDYLAGQAPLELDWLDSNQQHEEAWFLGLRTNAGLDLLALEREFGREAVAAALEKVDQLTENGLLAREGTKIRLTHAGRLLSNDVFQEFLGLVPHAGELHPAG